MKSLRLIKLSICGPSDVAAEVEIARRVVDDWNRLHAEARGLTIKPQHWLTDSYPNASTTGQGAINEQMIDESDILVAMFWTRLGTPTADAASGTAEEIKRGIAKGKKVLVYFSNREPLPVGADQEQGELLWQFRQELRATSSCWSFQTHTHFREEFTNHLALALNGFTGEAKAARKPRGSTVKQAAKGTAIVQIAGDGNQVTHYAKPPVVKNVLERDPEAVTPTEQLQIAGWIEALVEGTVGKSRTEAFKEWGGRLLKRFKIARRDQLKSSRLSEVEAWFRQQRAIQTRGHKKKAPNRWTSSRITAIKAAMSAMKKDKEIYYAELTERLN